MEWATFYFRMYVFNTREKSISFLNKKIFVCNMEYGCGGHWYPPRGTYDKKVKKYFNFLNN